MKEGTLCYPVVDDRVLLIEKKRGVGAGKVNGPGGKLEDGETPAEAAIRETREETRVTVDDLAKCGELTFHFGEEPFMFVHVFRADAVAGEPRETREAAPMWVDVDAVPYDEMWEDDRLWLPHVFDGRTFRGEFRFDAAGEEMLEHDLDVGVSFD